MVLLWGMGLGLGVIACAEAPTTKPASDTGPSVVQNNATPPTDEEQSPDLDVPEAESKVKLPDRLSFTTDTDLTVEPSVSVPVRVQAEPKGSYTVGFALVGESSDAALDRSEAVTDQDGVATVNLTASSSPATFTIRATVEREVVAELSVVVADDGSIEVLVVGHYSGKREPETWFADFYPGSSCRDLSSNDTLQAALSAQAQGEPRVLIDGVLPDRAAAFVLSGNGLVQGCTDVTSFVTQDEPLEVSVTLKDTPISLTDAVLPVQLATPAESRPLADGVWASEAAFSAAFLGNSQTHDLLALLDAMQQVAPSSVQSELAELRRQGSWDASILMNSSSSRRSDVLRDTLRGWIADGTDRLVSDDALRLDLALLPDDDSTPYVTVRKIAGHDAEGCGVEPQAELSRQTEGDDRLLWSASLTWKDAELLGCLAEETALQLEGATTVPEALGQVLGCEAWTEELLARVSWSGSIPQVCGAACLANLCIQGIEALWDQALAAPALASGSTLSISAAGDLTLDLSASPEQTSGTWVGLLTSPITGVTVSGTYEPPHG